MTLVLYWIAFIGLFFGILNILPVAGQIAPELQAGLTLIVSNMKAWNALFPITELLASVGVMMAFYIGKYGWKAIKWVIHVVRGGGTS